MKKVGLVVVTGIVMTMYVICGTEMVRSRAAESIAEPQNVAEEEKSVSKTAESVSKAPESVSKASEIVSKAAVVPVQQFDGYCIEYCDKKITTEDFKLMAKTVYAEAGNQPDEAQRLVALTIINRMAEDGGIFPDSVSEVIYAWNAYEVTTLSWWPEIEYDERAETNTYLAIATYPMEPKNLYYFRDSYYHGFGSPYKAIGEMYFSTENADMTRW